MSVISQEWIEKIDEKMAATFNNPKSNEERDEERGQPIHTVRRPSNKIEA